MIDGVKIENFRSIRLAEVQGFRRVNLVVGDNGAGKTALLEALHVGGSSDAPNAAGRLDRLRGITNAPTSRYRVNLSERWDNLFHWPSRGAPIHLTLFGSVYKATTVTIRRSSRPAEPTIEEESEIEERTTRDEQTRRDEQIRIERTIAGRVYRDDPEDEFGEVEALPSDIDSALTSIFFPATTLPSSSTNARLFSTLAKSGSEQQFEDAFRKQFPDVDGLIVLAESNTPQLYARRGGDRRPVSLNLLSAGMTRLAAYLLSIATTPGGTILFDEVESGLYWERYPLLWRQLHSFSKAYNTQVFASSHSHECNAAALETMMRAPDDFALVRIGQASGETNVRVVTGQDAIDLIGSGFEYR